MNEITDPAVSEGAVPEKKKKYRALFITSCVFSVLTAVAVGMELYMKLSVQPLLDGASGAEAVGAVIGAVFLLVLVICFGIAAAVLAIPGFVCALVALRRRLPRPVRVISLVLVILCAACFAAALLLIFI